MVGSDVNIYCFKFIILSVLKILGNKNIQSFISTSSVDRVFPLGQLLSAMRNKTVVFMFVCELQDFTSKVRSVVFSCKTIIAKIHACKACLTEKMNVMVTS